MVYVYEQFYENELGCGYAYEYEFEWFLEVFFGMTRSSLDVVIMIGPDLAFS